MSPDPVVATDASNATPRVGEFDILNFGFGLGLDLDSGFDNIGDLLANEGMDWFNGVIG
jgi:hypothetical protein